MYDQNSIFDQSFYLYTKIVNFQKKNIFDVQKSS